MSGITQLDRGEYGELYHHAFGKRAGREACRAGYQRWQEVLSSGANMMVLHPTGASMPAPQPTDYHIIASCGPLRFRWRVAEGLLATLPEQWIQFRSQAETLGHIVVGRDPRKNARAFVHEVLVDGYVMHPTFGPAIAASVVWLLTTSELIPTIAGFRLIGYDIAYVPGPAGQARMFNFRAILSPIVDAEGLEATEAARSLPLPKWRPPPA